MLDAAMISAKLKRLGFKNTVTSRYAFEEDAEIRLSRDLTVQIGERYMHLLEERPGGIFFLHQESRSVEDLVNKIKAVWEKKK